jgi:hypothetical protein
MDPETPEADAAEQIRPAVLDEDSVEPEVDLPLDANPADLVDQHLEVPDDEPYERG